MRQGLLVCDVPAVLDSFEISVQLARHGFRAVEDNFDGSIHRVWIHCPHGAAEDREAVRRIIAEALNVQTGGTEMVTFDDEAAN